VHSAASIACRMVSPHCVLSLPADLLTPPCNRMVFLAPLPLLKPRHTRQSRRPPFASRLQFTRSGPCCPQASVFTPTFSSVGESGVEKLKFTNVGELRGRVRAHTVDHLSGARLFELDDSNPHSPVLGLAETHPCSCLSHPSFSSWSEIYHTPVRPPCPSGTCGVC
jgi:hypothetical protein